MFRDTLNLIRAMCGLKCSRNYHFILVCNYKKTELTVPYVPMQLASSNVYSANIVLCFKLLVNLII